MSITPSYPLPTPAVPLRGAVVTDDFIRGFVAAGLLAMVQERASEGARLDRRTLRLALQGGTSLAVGTMAAQAWRQQDMGRALLAIAAGAAGVVVFEKLIRDQATQESGHEQA